MKAGSGNSSDRAYQSGNLRKYQSANPLRRILVRRMQERVARLALECCGRPGPVRVLDAGCGEGFNAAMLEKRMPGARIVLLDMSGEALEYARTLCSGHCEFRLGSVLELSFPEAAFDLVLCTEVLEHLEEPEQALSELLRVSSGRVLISVPEEPWFRAGNLLTLRNVRRLGNPPDHVNHWTYSGFRQWILQRTGGWSTVLCRSFPWTLALLQREKQEE